MSTKQIADHFSESLEILQKFNNSDNYNKIVKAGQIMVSSINNGGKIISCGNGGSMCDAMHFAEELTGRYRDDRKSIGEFQLVTQAIFLVLVMIMVLILFFLASSKVLAKKMMYYLRFLLQEILKTLLMQLK